MKMENQLFQFWYLKATAPYGAKRFHILNDLF